MDRKIFSPRIPGYMKYFFIMAGILLSFSIAVIAQSLFKPLMAALIIAILLKPLASRLERLIRSRILSAILSTCALLIAVVLLLVLIFSLAQDITADMDKLTAGFGVLLDKTQQWLESVFGFSSDKQISLLKNSSSELAKKITAFLPDFLIAASDFFAEFTLFIISLFFFIYYRQFLLRFLFKLSSPRSHQQLKTILDSIQKIIRKYILGLLLVTITTGILNTVGLLILGIKHAVLFGIVAGILTIIPYIGIVIGSILPVLLTIGTTQSLWYPLGVILIFSFVQFLEGNFITPKIIGEQVSLNPLAGLLALFISGKFFGILGVILALPCLAIIKIILDHNNRLKPFGYLLGNPE